MEKSKIELLNEELINKKARWVARETTHSHLSDEHKKALCGAIPDEAFLNSIKASQPIMEVSMASTPTSIDWRNNNGNFVTSIKNQAHCGSCVSFATVALIESMALIEHGVQLCLSEADSHFCSSHGANCSGWSPNTALDQAKVRGIVEEYSFPYATAFPNNNPNCSNPANPGTYCNIICASVPNRQNNAITIANWSTILQNRKQQLVAGPVTASFDVYEDFYNYSSGVYHHVSGNYVGGHCIEIIGYNDTNQCWICKNSWGTGWGESGFFEIAYGQCNIDTYPFYSCSGVQYPSDGLQFYRYYNGTDHFYTTNYYELGAGASGYHSEGVSCNILPFQIASTVPLYRYYNGTDHFYTTNINELGPVGKNGYHFEEIAGYVFASQQTGLLPLYRYYNGIDHFYTTNINELGPVGKNGYHFEEIQCYVYPSA